jgi:hypothetical protein
LLTTFKSIYNKWSNIWYNDKKISYISVEINANNSEINRNDIKIRQQMEITAPVSVGWVKSLGILR